MPGVSNEQIAAARSVDLLSYLQSHEPGSIRKSGPDEYCLADHDSLKISNGKWFGFSRGIGSNNALDFLIQVRGLNFTEAVKTLADDMPAPASSHQAAQPIPEKPKKPLILPEPYRDNFRVMAYLMGRGIDRAVIDRCIKTGTLYESKERHNCVFVGKDGDTPRFACLRGIFGSFKQDVEGSDKRHSFVFPAQGESKVLNVFESPIDTLSFLTIDLQNGQSFGKEHYLSLGGVSPRALTHYLNTHPEINDVRLRLDNDVPGMEAMARIAEELQSNPKTAGIRVTCEASPVGKDWNDLLQCLKVNERAEKLSSRPKEAAISL